MIKKIFFTLVLLCFASTLPAAEITYDVEFVRKKIKTGKKEIVEKNMVLTAEEREVFWPLYTEYQQELRKINDRLLKLIQAYAEAYETMTDEQARTLLDDYYRVEKKRIKLKQSYVKKFRRKLPSKIVTRYFQIENKMEAIMKVELADAIPLVY